MFRLQISGGGSEGVSKLGMASKSESGGSVGAAKSGVVEEKGKLEAGFLEEDDEFEEFPLEEWTAAAEEDEEEANIWEDNWDDELQQDDFAKQLQEELAKVDAQAKK